MLSIRPGTECGEVLPPTAAGKRRGLTWALVTDRVGEAGGILVVSQEGQREPRHYLVTEHAPCGFDGRVFECRKLGCGVSYTVAIGRNGQDHICDCEAGCYGRVGACVHVLALKAVLANDWFPHPQDVAVLGEPTAAELDAMVAAFGG